MGRQSHSLLKKKVLLNVGICFRCVDTEYVCIHGWDDDGFEDVVCCWCVLLVWVFSLIHYLKKK